MKRKICYVVGAGENYGLDFTACPADMIIAVDAGLRYIEQSGMTADLVIGDFDTLHFKPEHPNVIELNAEKDDTDMLAAVREGIKAGYEVFHIYCGMGGRVEHTIANIQILAKLSQNGKQGFLFGRDCTISAITNKTLFFNSQASGFVSVFSYSEKSEGVYIKGLKYELHNATLTNSFPIGVSNEFIGRESSVVVTNGDTIGCLPKNNNGGFYSMKKVLSIAGSDCSGGAGIQADLKTFSAHGVYGMSVIVSVVAENTSRVIDIQDITPDMISKQIDAVFEDIEVDAVKIGMLSTPQCMCAVAEKLREYKPHNVVIDPVMYAKNGCALMKPMAVQTLIDVIIPLADVLTPNIPEAEKIADMKITSVTDMEAAARKIYDMGCKAVVVKGGHAVGNALDVLFDGESIYHFETARIATKNTHGTGCTFSSAIAAQLAKGLRINEAVATAKNYVTMAIEHSLAIGKGNGPTHHFYELYKYGLKESEDI